MFTCVNAEALVASEGVDCTIAKGGVAIPFPWRLHQLLKAAAEAGLESVVSWAEHGRAFTVNNPKAFEEGIMKRYVKTGWNLGPRLVI